MKSYHYLLFTGILLGSVLLNSTGITWGVPSAGRVGLLGAAYAPAAPFFGAMKQARDRIYQFSSGSPVGRLEGANAGVTPIMASMGLTMNGNTLLTARENGLANMVRPYLLRTCHTDEQMTIASLSGMRPQRLDLNPRVFAYGGVYIYGMGGVFATGHLLHLVSLNRDICFYFAHPDEMGKLFILGRCTNIVFAALLLVMVLLAGKELYSVRTGMLAALICAVSPGLVFQAHVMKPYMMSSFFALSCVYFSALLLKNPSRRPYLVAAGICAGLAAGAMSLYGMILAAPAAAVLLAPGKNDRGRRILLLCAVSALVFIITNPYWLFRFTEMRLEMQGSRSVYSSVISAPLFWNFLRHMLVPVLSPSIAFIVLAGMLYAMLRRSGSEWMLLAVSAAPLLLFSWLLQNQEYSMHLSRFTLPWIASGAILGARAIDRLLENKRCRLPVTAIAAFLLLVAGLQAWVYVRNFSLDATGASTRLSAGRWINEHVPSGSLIGIADMPEPALVPPFDFARYRVALIRKTPPNVERPVDYLVMLDDNPLKGKPLKGYRRVASFAPYGSPLIPWFHPAPSHVNPPVSVYRYSPREEERLL